MTPRATRSDVRVPVTVLTGFLGSGKTTLLNHLLQQPALSESAVIINEFGEIGLDHLLVSTPAENMVLLDTGCLCCTVRGDFVETLIDLFRKRAAGTVPRFTSLVIETTGLADPVPVLQSIVADPALADVYSLHNVLSLVDAVNGQAQLEAHCESVKQAAVADTLLITKTDLASDEAVIALQRRLRRLNPGAAIHAIVHGRIDASALLQAVIYDPATKGPEVARWLRAQQFQFEPHHGADAHSAEERRHDHTITAFGFYHERPIRRAGLVLWLDMLAGLRGANLLRVKGVLNVDGDPVVVNAVQSIIHEPIVLEAWPDDERRSRIVVIARGIERQEIERTFEAFDFEPPATKSGAFDARAYARFVEAMKGFG